jgi:hypothetical protein
MSRSRSAGPMQRLRSSIIVSFVGLKFNNQSQGFDSWFARPRQIASNRAAMRLSRRENIPSKSKGELRLRASERSRQTGRTSGNIVKVRLWQRLYHLEEYEIFSASLLKAVFLHNKLLFRYIIIMHYCKQPGDAEERKSHPVRRVHSRILLLWRPAGKCSWEKQHSREEKDPAQHSVF